MTRRQLAHYLVHLLVGVAVFLAGVGFARTAAFHHAKEPRP